MRIVPQSRNGQVLVTFDMAGGFTEAVREAIHSGLRTSFTYEIDLRLSVPAWVDRTIASAVVTSSVQYDNLTRRHRVERTIDGRSGEPQILDDEELVRELLTSFDGLALFDARALQPDRDYYVRVRATARPLNDAPLLWPWGANGPSGRANLIFLP
jgi:hypothetical protein